MTKDEDKMIVPGHLIDYMVSDDDYISNPATKTLVKRLRKDLKLATEMVGIREARYLVDSYYEVQKFRLAVGNQLRAIGESKEPTTLIGFLFDNLAYLEDIIKQSLGSFASRYAVGKWLQSICGIGPVLSAGFLVTFDIRRKSILVIEGKSTKEEWVSENLDVLKKIESGKLRKIGEKYDPLSTAGSFWRYAGLDPTLTWEKGQKRPWNDRAKVLCYKAGECFVKCQNLDQDVYGKIYAERKLQEIARNDSGIFSDQAAHALDSKNYRKTTDAYKHYVEGHLPPAHIHARARRRSVQIFLSHLHNVMYMDYTGRDAPVPYVFSDKFKGGVHTKYIAPLEFDPKVGEPLSVLYAAEDKK